MAFWRQDTGDPQVKVCLWMTTIRKCIFYQSWTSRKKELDHQRWPCLRECCLLLCGCCKRAVLAMILCDRSSCPFSYWEYMPNLTTGCTSLGLQWEWDRRIPSLGFKFHQILLQWVRKEHFPDPEFHWKSVLSISKL